MGGKLIILAILILCSCNGKDKPDWIQVLGETNENASVHILIPLENSCGTCQIYLGEWLSENQFHYETTNLQIILIGKDSFILNDYKEQYLSLFPSILEDQELRFLNSNYLEGEYPYFKIKLIELKDGELVGSLSLEPGHRALIYDQLEAFFDLVK